MKLKEYFDNGLDYEEYLNLLGDNLKLHQQHYNRMQMSDSEIKMIKKSQPINILILTETWCGDSLAILPVIRKIAEVHGVWGFKILLRDQHLKLMDLFLTRGGRAVPIFLFLDKSLSMICKWGPRPKKAQGIYEKYRQDIENGNVQKMEVLVKIRNFYAKDRGQSILKELYSMLQNHSLL